MAGRSVTVVGVRHPDVLRDVTAKQLRTRVTGATFVRCWRRAKSVILDLSTGERLVVQPRFTGALLLDAGDLPESERRYSTLAFHLDDGRVLHYRDIRRLGTVALMNEGRFERYSSAIGPEPLDPEFTADRFRDILRGSRQSVKTVIMNQQRLAGVGNIYANESLWRAGIDPSRPAKTISVDRGDPPRSLDRIRALRAALVDVLTEAIAARGTSFRDYRDASGERGSFAEHLDVYGRAGLPCRRCGSRLIGTHAVDGRMTVFCAHCQR
jgi:formamidopyrimidine-DNA glycosylase